MKRTSKNYKNKTDMVKVASASCEYDELKPGAGQRVTLNKIARENGLCVYQLWNFRRGIKRSNQTEHITL